jgi:hypothetical protein
LSGDVGIIRLQARVNSGRVVSRWIVSRWVNGRGVHQHDRNVVLNGVNAAAFAAFQTLPVPTRDHRLLANRANQQGKEILGNHADHCNSARRNAAQRSGNFQWQLLYHAGPFGFPLGFARGFGKTGQASGNTWEGDAIESLFNSRHAAAR